MNGYLVKYALKTLNINQEQLSKKLKVSKATIAQWKNDKTEIPWEKEDRIADLLDLPRDGEYEFQLTALCGGKAKFKAYRKSVKEIIERCSEDYDGMWHTERFLKWLGTNSTLYSIFTSLYEYKCPIPDGEEFFRRVSSDEGPYELDDEFNALAVVLHHYVMVQVWCEAVLHQLPLEQADFPDPFAFEYLFADYLVAKQLSQFNSTADKDLIEYGANFKKAELENCLHEIIMEHHKRGFGVPYDLFQIITDDDLFLEEASVYKKPEGMDKYLSYGERRILVKLWEAEVARYYISGYGGQMPEYPFK